MALRRRVGPVFGIMAVALCTAVATGVWAPVSAQEGPSRPSGTVSLASVMTGEGGGVVATATSSFDDLGATVMVTVRNSTAADVSVEVPYGAMFVPAQESQQTVVTGGPRDPEAAALARSAAEPTITAPPGESSHALVAFCGEELDHSPRHAVPVSYGGVAKDPLPKVLRNIASTQPHENAAQDAVWWVTDEPKVPISDSAVAELLDGVDTDGFAANPTKVVPSDSYTPKWAGGGSAVIAPPGLGRPGTAGFAAQLGLLLIVLTGGAITLALLVGRKPKARLAAVAPSRAAGPWGGPIASPPGGRPPLDGVLPGWYADPWSNGQRYWDGRGWTDGRRGP